MAETLDAVDERPVWDVPMPPGGWGSPWPQCVELAKALPSTKWTLVGGLMVQLHAAAAGMAATRPTADVDIVLHIETGAINAAGITEVLGKLGYSLQGSLDKGSKAHRWVRGEDEEEQIDVMVADRLPPGKVPTFGGRDSFQVPAGTAALKRTVNCRIDIGDGETVMISVPNTLGALALKGAAYREDNKDNERHLDDGAVLCATMKNPLETSQQMKGSDRSRILALHSKLSDPDHISWMTLEPGDRAHGQDVLRILCANPQSAAPLPKRRRS